MDPKFPLPEFEAFVHQTLKLWGVPGAAVSVVKKDSVIHCAGYGLRDIAHGLPVTSDTIFPIASCTKAFTALAAAILVEEGRLEWDKPVREYLPDFRLQDDFATQRLTVRDLLCHRSGLPGHDMLWYGSNFGTREMYERLRYLEPSRDLRAAFQYQNLMYLVAGLLIQRVTGRGWETLVQECIFNPSGMRRSGFSTTRLQQDSDYSRPYLSQDGEPREIPFFVQDGDKKGTGAAGAITSCASDMGRWLHIHLGNGRLGERLKEGSLFPAKLIEQLRQPQIFYDDPSGRQRFGYEFTSYGLGWFLRLHKGQVLAWHDGNTDGFTSFVALVPRHNLGVVVLSNGDFSPAPGILAYTIIDRLLGLELTDWNAEEKSTIAEIMEYIQKCREQTARDRQAAPPSHTIDAYLGDYQHPAYGEVKVYLEGQTLKIAINGVLDYPMEHYHYDVFEIIDERFGKREKATFMTDGEGKINCLLVKLDPVVKEAVFTRCPEGHTA